MNEKGVQIESLKNFSFTPKWESQKNERQNFKPKTRSNKTKLRKLNNNRPQSEYIFKFSLGHAVTESLKKKLRDSGITWAIDELVNEIIRQKAYDITISLKNGSTSFKKLRNTSKIFKDENSAIMEVMLGEGSVVTLTQKEIKKLDTSFNHVLVYEKNNNYFPPKSSSYFSNIIDAYIFNNKIKINKEKFIDQLKKSSDIEHLENVKAMTAKENVFTLNKKTFTSLEGITAEIKRNEENLYIQNVNKVRFAANKWLEKSKDIELQKDLLDTKDSTIKKELHNIIKIIARKSNFQLSKLQKKDYICAYRPQNLNINKLSSDCKKILHLCTKSKSTKIHNFFEKSNELSISKTIILQEIKWLIKSGIIRQFPSGKIEMVK